MPAGFEVRGVIEGFYGTPWTDAARRAVMAHLAARGMNAYVYAPKDDAYHRRRWREPYPDEALAELVGLHADLARLGVRFGFALSPGLDIAYADADDRRAIWAKLAPLVDAGVDWLVLAFDDVPLRPGSGGAQGELVGWIRATAPDVQVSVVPTDYVGVHATPYLDELARALPAEVDVMWTGTSVVSPTISVDDARRRRRAQGEHPLLIWDNFPVNDAFMASSLHLGPLTGRDPGLVDVCRGLLANPMCQPRASLPALGTVAEFLVDPHAYDPATAWRRALADLAPPPFAALARACASSGLERRVPLHVLVDAVVAGASDSLDDLAAELRLVAAAGEGLDEDLTLEVAPWMEQAAREARAGLAAVALLRGGGSDDTWSAALATMGVLFAWDAARRGSHVAYGARFACYPAIVQRDDGSVGLDPDLAVVEDANAIDDLCRHALAQAAPAPAPAPA